MGQATNESMEIIMLEVKQLTITYDGFLAVNRVTFSLDKGQTGALIGLNGAGKSSLLTCIAGVTEAEEGNVYFEGEDITFLSAAQRVRKKIALVPEGRQVFSNLTVYENLLVGGHTGRGSDKKAKQLLEEFPMLKAFKGKMAGKLSGGQQQLLAIARAMMVSPKLLLVDEPTMGLTPKNSKYVLEYLKGLSEKGVTVLVSSSSLKPVENLFSPLFFMEMGEIENR